MESQNANGFSGLSAASNAVTVGDVVTQPGNDALLGDNPTPQPHVSPLNEQPNLQLSGAQINDRAQEWLNPPVPYNESEYWQSTSDFWGDGNGDSPAPGGNPPAWREDCSGFVSFAWGFSNSDGGFTTYSFSNEANQFTPNPYATPLPSWSDLQTGDALVYNGPTLGDGTMNHMVLFDGWNGTPGASSFQIVQEAHTGVLTSESTFTMNDSVLSHFLPIRSVGYTAATPPPPPVAATQVVSSQNGSGYYILSPQGGVYAYGGAPFYGSAAGAPYFEGETAAALVVNHFGTGYWILSKSGGVYAYGGAGYYGAPAGQSYFDGETAVGMISSADGAGYTILSASGGVYAYGDGTFNGARPVRATSTEKRRLAS